jgi:hypothetical protein
MFLVNCFQKRSCVVGELCLEKKVALSVKKSSKEHVLLKNIKTTKGCRESHRNKCRKLCIVLVFVGMYSGETVDKKEEVEGQLCYLKLPT